MKHQKLVGSALGLVVVAGGITTVAYAGESTEPSPLEGCQQSELAVPDGAERDAMIQAVSPSGEYIAGKVDGTATLWRDGEPEAMSDEIPSHHWISGVTSSGVAVTDEGLRYEDGAVTQLEIPERGEVISINDAGDIIGQVTRVEGEGSEAYPVPVTPLIWQDGEMRELDLESGNRGGVRAITDDGTIVGFQTDMDDPREDTGVPWMWTVDGDSRPLQELDEEKDQQPSDAVGDWVVTYHKSRDSSRYTLSNPEEAEQLNEEIRPRYIDETGRVWGTSGTAPAYQDGDEIVKLPDELGEGTEDPYLRGVNADGTVAVGVVGHGTGGIPTVWNCEH